MQRKTLKTLHNQLSWNTKIYTLLAICVILIARFSDALNTNFALTIILALLIVLFVESFAIISVKHPTAWKYIKWLIMLAALMLIAVGWRPD